MSKPGSEASVDPALLPIVIPQDDPPTSLVPHSLFGLEVFPTQASIFAFLTETLESSAWRDGLKLLIIGGTMEAARRGCYSLFTKIYDSLIIEAFIQDHDVSYDWILAYLSAPENQSNAHTFEITTRTPNAGNHSQEENSISRAQAWNALEGISLLPGFGKPRWIKFEGSYLYIQRGREIVGPGDPKESIVISTFSRSKHLIHRLITVARQTYIDRDKSRIVIYASGRTGWHRNAAVVPRSIDSVLLPNGIKERLVEDVREFLMAKDWYVQRGIPHRRGYLLYGVPGSGKTSLCTAVAGIFGMAVHVINLNEKGLDDQALNMLTTSTSPGSMVLMEDIDCAFGNRDNDIDADPSKSSGVTLSGLLNAIDGVSSQEGSVVFATTNHKDQLDPALKRPGRMDVWVEFKNATQDQVSELFLHFYPSLEQESMESSIIEKKLLYTTAERESLAEEFAKSIPNDRFSMAQLQGYLMLYKNSPSKAVKGVKDWIKDNEVER